MFLLTLSHCKALCTCLCCVSLLGSPSWCCGYTRRRCTGTCAQCHADSDKPAAVHRPAHQLLHSMIAPVTFTFASQYKQSFVSTPLNDYSANAAKARHTARVRRSLARWCAASKRKTISLTLVTVRHGHRFWSVSRSGADAGMRERCGEGETFDCG